MEHIEEIIQLISEVIEYCSDKNCENTKMKLIRIHNRFSELVEEIEDIKFINKKYSEIVS